VTGPARLDVATTCPACGAPLEVTEGATSARCGHCGNRLLLPGRRRVMTYVARAKTPAEHALALARAVASAARDPEPWLLPYYRYTAEELRWQWPPLPPGQEHAQPDPTRVPQLVEAAIERNFLACAWDGLGLYSMGVRTTALRLELFRTDALGADVRVAGPETAADAALAHALRTTDAALIAHRAVVCGVLSLVYFPVWMIPLGAGESCRFAVVDAIAGTLVTREGPPHLRERLARAAVPPVTAVEPRVLACPNCGWDLPDDPDHVIFFCEHCARAWRHVEQRLEPASHLVVPPRVAGAPIQHLPLWLVDARGAPSVPGPIAVPAFRHRARRLVVTLATQLTRKRPDRPTGEVTPARSPAGGYLDAADARTLARFVAAGIDRSVADALDLGEPWLAWWPFERLAGSLREPFTRFALPATSTVAAVSARPARTGSGP
jgi:predicted RNA-binding Zn-ribbon protein involved in translation (DUF1610 family)